MVSSSSVRDTRSIVLAALAAFLRTACASKLYVTDSNTGDSR